MKDIERRETIRACAGDTVALHAPGEGIGGYLWHADIPPEIGTVVDEALGSDPAGIGGGPDKVFRIRLKKAGDAVVRLVQSRPWDAQPARVIEYPIHCAAARKP